jgi:hypothetical protein
VTENHGVGGSIPPLGTNEIKYLAENKRWTKKRRVRLVSVKPMPVFALAAQAKPGRLSADRARVDRHA